MSDDLDKLICDEFLPEELIKEKRELVEEWKDYIKVGDIYVDGFGHPTLCMEVEINYIGIGLEGISLYDGSYPRGCCVIHQAIEKISLEEAWEMKLAYEKAKNPNCCKH